VEEACEVVRSRTPEVVLSKCLSILKMVSHPIRKWHFRVSRLMLTLIGSPVLGIISLALSLTHQGLLDWRVSSNSNSWGHMTPWFITNSQEREAVTGRVTRNVEELRS